MTVRTPTRPIRTSARDGFIIVAVLWILAALAALATIYSIYIKNSALAVSVMDDELQAEALVSASLELTAYQLAVPKDTQGATDVSTLDRLSASAERSTRNRSSASDARTIWFPSRSGQCSCEFHFRGGPY